MSINKVLIQNKIDIIERNLKFLIEYKDKNEKDFLNSYKDVQAVKYSLFEVIESCIDIASHIISAKGFERAETYAEMFEILDKNNILKSDLAKNLSNMARFRNVLVHGYSKIDDSKILVFVKKELFDVQKFVKIILELIELLHDSDSYRKYI